MSLLMSIYLFCFQQLPVSIDIISIFCFIKALPCKISFLPHIIYHGVHNFCSIEPHFGHRGNYHVSKSIAEHIQSIAERIVIY